MSFATLIMETKAIEKISLLIGCTISIEAKVWLKFIIKFTLTIKKFTQFKNTRKKSSKLKRKNNLLDYY
jgi:hypothetical protein